MLGEAAAPLGITLIFLDPTPRAPGHPVATEQIVADFDDTDAIGRLAEQSDVLSYEIELVDDESLATVRDRHDVPVHPAPETLSMIQDKLVQKRTLRDHGVPVPDFRAVGSLPELREALDELGCPAMLKARRGGYDGRGNRLVRSREEAPRALKSMPGDCMLEELVDFEREVSVMAARGANQRRTYPATETVHEEEILRRTLTPARSSDRVRARARERAVEVLGLLEGRGVYGIEMFEAGGEILINEIAPRPHNSGHWTIEGAKTSQFEQHLRAVTGQPLGSTDLIQPTVSVNILGTGSESRPARLRNVRSVLTNPNIHFHWYGKREVRPLRKMGHLTLTGADPGALIAQADSAREELTFSP